MARPSKRIKGNSGPKARSRKYQDTARCTCGHRYDEHVYDNKGAMACTKNHCGCASFNNRNR